MLFEFCYNSSFESVIAFDGAALPLLKKEFPELKTKELLSYNIEHSEKSSNFKLKLLLNNSKIAKAITAEKKPPRKS